MMEKNKKWVELTLPPRPDMLPALQSAVSAMASQCGFDKKKSLRIELAVEEMFLTILRYSFSEDEGDEENITVRLEITPPFFRVTAIDSGLPFDLSMIPEYDALTAKDADCDDSALSLYLINHSVDRCEVVNSGREGLRFKMAWFLPADHIDTLAETLPADEPKEVEPVKDVRLLDGEFAIKVARLVFRGYGNSYVYEDIYYPDRIRAHYESDTLKSWGAVTISGRVVGHLALMKDSADSKAIEWGVAIVDPKWRGLKLMQKMLEAAIKHAEGRDEPVLYAHSVTAHPYTQKTCSRYGFTPTALLLGYAPSTIKFKGINDKLKQRESTFLSVRCLRPLPAARLYIPSWHDAVIRRLLKNIDTELKDEMLTEADEEAAAANENTAYTSLTSRGINAAKIQIEKTGEDIESVVRREKLRLCGERVDVIYITVDLADPASAKVVRAVEKEGFFIAGLTPMMNPAYGLTFQYLNNSAVSFDAVCAHGETAQWLKDIVKSHALN